MSLLTAQKEEAPSGSVRDRLEDLTRAVNELDKIGHALEAALSPVLRLPTPEVGGQSSLGSVRRAPQCNIAVGVDTAAEVVRDTINRINDIIHRLEV